MKVNTEIKLQPYDKLSLLCEVDSLRKERDALLLQIGELDRALKEERARLAIAINWLRRIEREYPGSLNADAIEKHLEDYGKLGA